MAEIPEEFCAVPLKPSWKRVKNTGSRLGNGLSKRVPNAARLKPTGGDTAVAATSRHKLVLGSRSRIRFDMRKSASPRKLPPMPVLIWSLREGGVASPAISQKALPRKV